MKMIMLLRCFQGFQSYEVRMEKEQLRQCINIIEMVISRNVLSYKKVGGSFENLEEIFNLEFIIYLNYL